ncbi:CDP-diacylglycerol--serine O-phosphatidyltransferase [Roseivirga sp. BDSF3-8]|uniref:CDP-diacylglycerol--serine O-phosphatidyltransferase n=1 Tax=Roseivirga sp. BDSF3-8 TaxID=3241598 RepID=UPI003531F8EB
MSIKKHIPNILTCANLFSGCVGIVQVLNGQPEWAAYMVWLAAVFDFLDGFVARMLKVQSPIGKELDSLADNVTFGVLPATLVFYLLSQNAVPFEHLPYAGFMLSVFAALRLAKFNTDTRQSDSFIGVPTPAMALFVTSLPLVLADTGYDWITSNWFLLAVTVVFSLLMVAELNLLALKFKDFTFKNNRLRFILIGLSGAMLFILGITAVPLIIILYVTLSLIATK